MLRHLIYTFDLIYSLRMADKRKQRNINLDCLLPYTDNSQ